MKHSLKHLHTATAEAPNVPGSVVVVLVDGYQTDYYDSITKRAVPTQTWMSRATEDDPDYWKRQTSFWVDQEQCACAQIENFKERFNQTGGTSTTTNLTDFSIKHSCFIEESSGLLW